MAPTAMTAADLIGAVKRAIPREFWGPFEAAGAAAGWELYTAYAAIMARVSEAVVRLDTDWRLDTAPGGEYALGQVTVTRSSAPATPLTIGVGSELVTDRGIRVAVYGANIEWAAAENGARTLDVVGLAQAYSSNVKAGTLTAIDVLLPDGQDTTYETLTITNAAALTGGAPDILSLLAANRGVYRQQGEDTEAFRARARGLPDQVTPNAMRRALDAALIPLGFVEGTDYRYVEGIAWGGAADDDLAADDDDADITTSAVDRTVRAFYVVVPNVSSVLQNHTGAHADDDDAADDCNADGTPDRAEAFYRALAADLDARRMAGIARFVVME